MRDCIKIAESKECCGCGACLSICPRNAVRMKEDEFGFIYPQVDSEKCIKCGKCVDICVFAKKGVGANGTPGVYAAVTNRKDILADSSSGGLFTEFAESIIDRDGVVFGAAWKDDLTVHHVCVDNKADLELLRGSKYVQSMTDDSYIRAKQFLDQGRMVCYSGTPCQISGLKSFLGREYENLFTIDIICQGVPSGRFLSDDLKMLSDKKNMSIKKLKFRDKEYGWGKTGSFCDENRKIKYDSNNSPYYFFFHNGELLRESCYNCRYPYENRQGDITLGDFWGIDRETVSKMVNVDRDDGISCVLVNTEKGKRWLEDIHHRITAALSDIEKARQRNGRLSRCSKPLREHQRLLNDYRKQGYTAIRNGYKRMWKNHFVRYIKMMVPRAIKNRVR